MRARRRSAGLTEREREVLVFIRLGLTNEEIGERLGMTLDGAKYHVSQILQKLGVASREEAAALPYERTLPWWARALAWSAAAKAALVVVTLAIVAGVAVMAWAVASTGSGDTGPVRAIGPMIPESGTPSASAAATSWTALSPAAPSRAATRSSTSSSRTFRPSRAVFLECPRHSGTLVRTEG